MQGTRINEMPNKLQEMKELLIDCSDMDQIKVVHEIVDDTPYKTKDYMKYMHDEYHIEHNRQEKILYSQEKYKLKANPEKYSDTTFVDVISQRTSLRDYKNKPIDFETFSNIIHYSFGVKNIGVGAYNKKEFPFKYSNSQGGLNYLDLYIVVHNVEGIKKGLYYYDFINDELCLMDEGNMRVLINEINFQNEFTVYGNFMCFIVADMDRVVPKYYKRAYRFSHVDSGILAAYLQLNAEYHQLGSCNVAGYLEHKLEDLLGLSSNEFPILSMCIGQKPEEF